MNKKVKNKKTIAVLMCTIALDMMGFLLIYPLFPKLLVAHNSVFGVSSSQTIKYAYYAFALAAWPVGNFFGTAFLGWVSDMIGRKRVLMMALFMVFSMYVVLVFSVTAHMVFLFILARLIQGFFGGNYDIAQAAIADISHPEEKAKNMSLIGVAVSIGIIIGPIVSSITTTPSLVSWFSIKTPFWIAACLAIFNMIWIGVVYEETYRPKQRSKIKLSKAFTAFLFVFTDKRLRQYGAVYFFFQSGWGLYVQQIPVVLQKYFAFTPNKIGAFFVVLGVGFVFAMQLVQPVLIKRFESRNIYFVAVSVLFTVLLIGGNVPIMDVEWFVVAVVSVLHVTCYGCFISTASNAVTSEEQGQTMGGLGSVGSMAMGFVSLSLVLFSAINVLLPIGLAGILYLVSGFLFFKG